MPIDRCVVVARVVIPRRRDTRARRKTRPIRSFERARTTCTRAPTAATTDDGARRAIDDDGDGEKANRRENDGADVDDARAREVLTRQATWFDVDVADGYDMAVVSTAGGREQPLYPR